MIAHLLMRTTNYLKLRLQFAIAVAIFTLVGICTVALADPNTFDLYYGPGTSSTAGIFRLGLDNPSNVQEIVPGSLVNTGTGIALDVFGRELYWIADTQFGSTPKIRRSALDGSNVQLFLNPTGQPADLEIDPISQKLYWTERISNTINVINLNGTGQQTLVATTEPRGMDLDLVNHKMYWVEFQSNKLRRADLDGSNVTDVITSGMNEPFDVTIDPIHNRLYWVELGPNDTNGKVWMAQLDGTQPTLIAQHQVQPTDLVLDLARNSIYWGDENGDTLWRANLDGTDMQRLPVPATNIYRNIALDAPPVAEPATVILALTGLVTLILCRCARREHERTRRRPRATNFRNVRRIVTIVGFSPITEISKMAHAAASTTTTTSEDATPGSAIDY